MQEEEHARRATEAIAAILKALKDELADAIDQRHDLYLFPDGDDYDGYDWDGLLHLSSDGMGRVLLNVIDEEGNTGVVYRRLPDGETACFPANWPLDVRFPD